MPVEQQTPFNEYTGNGVTTVFAFQFQVLIATDLAVFVDGAIKANGTDYTITGVGSQQGGQVTFSAAPASGADVLLAREMVFARDTDYQTNGDLREAVLDRDFDRIWLVLQGIASSVGTALRLPFPEQAAALPSFISRRDRILGFNSVTGVPEMTSFTMTQVASAIAAAYGTGSTLDALTFLQAGFGAVPRTAQDKSRELRTPQDYGAIANGLSDDTDALNKAFVGPVTLTKGIYLGNPFAVSRLFLKGIDAEIKKLDSSGNIISLDSADNSCITDIRIRANKGGNADASGHHIAVADGKEMSFSNIDILGAEGKGAGLLFYPNAIPFQERIIVTNIRGS
ncbi:hypothetical protein, partial [Comamonas testosteroni]